MGSFRSMSKLCTGANRVYVVFHRVHGLTNWSSGIEGHVSWGEDDPDIGTRVVTDLSLQHVQIRVSMRDAELFSLTFGCTQQPHYTECQWKHPSCDAIGTGHYRTIPCSSDAQCHGLGTCGDVFAVCREDGIGASDQGERICMVETGGEKGAMCGWY